MQEKVRDDSFVTKMNEDIEMQKEVTASTAPAEVKTPFFPFRREKSMQAKLDRVTMNHKKNRKRATKRKMASKSRKINRAS